VIVTPARPPSPASTEPLPFVSKYAVPLIDGVNAVVVTDLTLSLRSASFWALRIRALFEKDV
jgi:hypothetical protein